MFPPCASMRREKAKCWSSESSGGWVERLDGLTHGSVGELRACKAMVGV